MENVENLTSLSKSGLSSSQETLDSKESTTFTELVAISETEQRKRKNDSGDQNNEEKENNNVEVHRKRPLLSSSFDSPSSIHPQYSNITNSATSFEMRDKINALSEASEIIQEHAVGVKLSVKMSMEKS